MQIWYLGKYWSVSHWNHPHPPKAIWTEQGLYFYLVLGGTLCSETFNLMRVSDRPSTAAQLPVLCRKCEWTRAEACTAIGYLHPTTPGLALAVGTASKQDDSRSQGVRRMRLRERVVWVQLWKPGHLISLWGFFNEGPASSLRRESPPELQTHERHELIMPGGLLGAC